MKWFSDFVFRILTISDLGCHLKTCISLWIPRNTFASVMQFPVSFLFVLHSSGQILFLKHNFMYVFSAQRILAAAQWLAKKSRSLHCSWFCMKYRFPWHGFSYLMSTFSCKARLNYLTINFVMRSLFHISPMELIVSTFFSGSCRIQCLLGCLSHPAWLGVLCLLLCLQLDWYIMCLNLKLIHSIEKTLQMFKMLKENILRNILLFGPLS